MTDQVAAIARSVLYEGYILWPYRRSALKNQRRWTFGGVYPRAYSMAGHADDPWQTQTDCLIEAEPDDVVTVDVSVRFLHVVERRVIRRNTDGWSFVDSLSVGDDTYVSWQEATERVVEAPPITLGGPPVRVPITIDEGERSEPIVDAESATVGKIVRRWGALSGTVEVSAARVGRRAWRLRVNVANHSLWQGEPREAVLAHTLVSTHLLLSAHGGRFVSLTDPPAAFEKLATECANVGTWPVLVGDPARRDMLLSSPIILPDYPTVAPESGGDFFDGAEIDQLLVLNVLSLTDEEQREARSTDSRAQEILDRCRDMSPEDLFRLHGVTRDPPSAKVGL